MGWSWEKIGESSKESFGQLQTELSAFTGGILHKEEMESRGPGLPTDSYGLQGKEKYSFGKKTVRPLIPLWHMAGDSCLLRTHARTFQCWKPADVDLPSQLQQLEFNTRMAYFMRVNQGYTSFSLAVKWQKLWAKNFWKYQINI